MTGLVARTVSVLEAVAENSGATGPRELERKIGINRSAVGRILQNLTEIGVLHRIPEGYVPGHRLFRLGRIAVARDDVATAAMPILQRLSREYDETCYVCLRRGDAAFHIGGVESTNPVRYVVPLEEPFPLYAGAPGRAILSGLPADEVTEILERETLEAQTPATITDKQELLRLVQEDRERGYTASEGQRIEGGFAVAAPFFDNSGLCKGSLVFTCPALRLDRTRIPEYGSAVMEAAKTLSDRLGHIISN